MKNPLPGTWLAAGFLTAILAAGPAGAEVQTSGAKPEKPPADRQAPSTLAVSIPWQWLASNGGTMKVGCDAQKPADDEGVKMIEALSRSPRPKRYVGKADDGGTFTGTRNGEDFTFETLSKEGSKFVLQMPWLAARCMFGGAKLAGATSVELRAKDIGGRVRLEVTGPTKGVSVEVEK